MNPLVNKRCSPIEEMIYQDGFQAGAASRDAEVQRLQMALADAEALELGTAEKCDQLRAEIAAALAACKVKDEALTSLTIHRESAISSEYEAAVALGRRTEMTMPKFEPVAWLRDTLDGGLSTMTDCCTNVVKEIWLKANPKNVERYTAPLYTLDQLTKAYEAGERDQAAELEAARAEIERLENQVQARDAELWGRTQKILQLEQQLAAEQAKNVGLRDFIARAQVSSGVCCCGEPIDGHSSPMSCGHSPVDMWDHAVGKLLDAPSDTSSLEAIVKKAGEVMRERVVETILASAHGFPMREIRILPAVTLEDLK